MIKDILRANFRKLRRFGYSNGFLPITKPTLKTDLLVTQLTYLIDKYKPDTIIDVGANAGQFAGKMKSRVGFSGPIHCFEPDSNLMGELEALSAKEGNMFVHNRALGQEPGTLTMNISRISTLNSFLEPPKDGLDVGQHDIVEQKEIEVSTLDIFIEDLIAKGGGDRIFLKLDTQGFDLEVLAGLDKYVDRIAFILVEVAFQNIYENAPLYDDIFRAMDKRGFVFCGMPAANVAHDVVIDSDCLFLAKSLVKGIDLKN